jgi:hypothetical protein
VKKLLVLPLAIGLLLSGCSDSSVNKNKVQEPVITYDSHINMNDSNPKTIHYLTMNVLNKYEVKNQGVWGITKDDIEITFQQRMTLNKQIVEDRNFKNYVSSHYLQKGYKVNFIDLKKGHFPENTIYVLEAIPAKNMDSRYRYVYEILIGKNGAFYQGDIYSHDGKFGNSLSEAIDMMNTIQN